MTTVPLSGVALRTHEQPYPASAINPYEHQRALRALFQDEKEFVAVNDSPTGGGKTMSWLAPTVESGEHAIAVYPTNALIADQKRAIDEELEKHFPERETDIEVVHVTSEMLRTRYADQYRPDSNADILRAILRDKLWQNEQVVLLTNPDILVMMYRNLYRGGFGYQSTGDEIREVNEFATVVVDEFHRASRKEQNTLLFLLDEMCDKEEAICELSKLVFLSATPEARLERRFSKAMSAPYHRVTESDRRERTAFDVSPPEGWRSVMPPVELDVRNASTFGTAERLLGDDWEDTQSFCAREGKTVVILDGIHEVEVVTRRLRAEFPDQQIERIDGFHGSEKRDKLERFDVLVSNSAVEVGIDFEVKRLVFSGHNRASFLQRLGRIRGRIEDGADSRAVRCYVPDTVSKRVHELVEERDGRVSRDELTLWLNDAYVDPRKPDTFDWRYSAAEALAHVHRQAGKHVESEQKPIVEQGEERIERHFGRPEENIGLKEIKQFAGTVSQDVAAELQRYRGESLDVLVYDVSPDSENELKSYDPFYLLRYGNVEFLSETEFLQEIPPSLHDEVASKADYVVGFCVYRGTIPVTEEGYGRSVSFKATGEINAWFSREGERRTRKPKKASLSIDVERTTDGQSRVKSIEMLRTKMERKENAILCYPLKQNSRAVKRQYDLGNFFFLYGLAIPSADGMGCIALGTDALYLHCLVQEDEATFDHSDLGLDLGL